MIDIGASAASKNKIKMYIYAVWFCVSGRDQTRTFILLKEGSEVT